MIALTLLLVCLPEPAKASVVDVSGDVEVSLSSDGKGASPPSGVLELTQEIALA